MTDNKKAKLLLLEKDCKNCWYYGETKDGKGICVHTLNDPDDTHTCEQFRSFSTHKHILFKDEKNKKEDL